MDLSQYTRLKGELLIMLGFDPCNSDAFLLPALITKSKVLTAMLENELAVYRATNRCRCDD